LVLTEGVVLYLSNEQVGDLAEDLARCRHVERWVLEYFDSAAMRLRHLISHARARSLAKAPFRFNPDDWTMFFRVRGFQLREVCYVLEEGQRLGRRPPLRWWLRAGISLLPRRVRESLGRRYGYAVLERVRR
jgi:hypothetical protein